MGWCIGAIRPATVTYCWAARGRCVTNGTANRETSVIHHVFTPWHCPSSSTCCKGTAGAGRARRRGGRELRADSLTWVMVPKEMSGHKWWHATHGTLSEYCRIYCTAAPNALWFLQMNYKNILKKVCCTSLFEMYTKYKLGLLKNFI